MTPKQEPRHQDHDVPMPGDGTENAASVEDRPRDQSPLASEPVKRAPKPPKGKKTRTVREWEEDAPENQGRAEEPSYVDESPLAAEAEATLMQTHVSRVGPATGPGWGPGMQFDWGDGFGPQKVSKGPVGPFQRTADLYQQVVSVAGGGRFRFITKGEPTVEQEFPNPPLPLPMEEQQGGFPNGAQPNARGGFDRDPRGGYRSDFRGEPEPERDPFEDPDFDPAVGIDPEEIAQTGFTGWFRGGPYNKLIYVENGVPTRPRRGNRPPAALLAGGGGTGGYDPDAYDHSDRGSSKMEKLFEEMMKQQREDRDRFEKLASDRKGNDVFTTMFANQMQMQQASIAEAARQRDHEYKMAQLKAGADEKDRTARIAAEAASSIRSKEIEAAAITAKAGADERIAIAMAGASRDNANASIANAKEIAQISAGANERIMTMVTSMANKGDPINTLTKGMDIMANAMGGKGSVGEIAGALKDGVSMVTDAYVQVKTAGLGSTGGASVPNDEASIVERLVLVIVNAFEVDAPPQNVKGMLAAACIATGYDWNKIASMVSLATPEILSGQLKKIADGAVDEANKTKFQRASASIVTDKGKNWVNAVKSTFAPKPAPQPQIPGK